MNCEHFVFILSWEMGDVAVEVSHLVASEIGLTSKLNFEREFVGTCSLTALKITCPEKRQAFANINLTWNHVTDKSLEKSADMDSKLTVAV